jgi:hypothetical protein
MYESTAQEHQWKDRQGPSEKPSGRKNRKREKAMKLVTKLSIVLCFVLLAGCSQERGDTMDLTGENISDEALERVASKKILFAHMSVGNNILDGLRKTQEQDPRFKRLRITAFEPGMETKEPGLYHFLLGNNSRPDLKVNACQDVLLSGRAGEQFDVFMFKYCYVDFKKDTNVDDVFNDYKMMISRIKGEYPNLDIVHVTVPLTVRYSGLKGWLKFILGKRPPNDKRSLFNEMIIKEYDQVDPVFDLARMESTDTTGKRMSYTSNGKTVYYMVRDYTNDGGHLNETGQILAGLELIKTMSEIK